MARLELRNLASAAAALVVGVATATAEPIRITSGRREASNAVRTILTAFALSPLP